MFRFTARAVQTALFGRQLAQRSSPAPARLCDMWRQTWTRTMAAQSVRPGLVRRLLPKMGRAGQDSSGKLAAAATARRALSSPLRTAPRSLRLTGTGRRAFHSSRPRRSGKMPPKEPPGESLGFSARIKKLSREYGWVTVGVYTGLTILDFPFCFLLVRAVGTDRIAEVEHWVISNVSQFIPTRVKDTWHRWRKSSKEEDVEGAVTADGAPVGGDGWGVKEAQERNTSEASLGTQLALAYAIHKSFIFVRVPLTAAITPRVVKKLRSWGWQIGKRRSKR